MSIMAVIAEGWENCFVAFLCHKILLLRMLVLKIFRDSFTADDF